MTDHDNLEPSPAQMGETTTVQPGEWHPLDDHGTEIWVYGGKPVDIAFQIGAEDEIRQLQAALRPHRGDAIEAFIKQHRDTYGRDDDDARAWSALNDLLDDYREHADTGTPLDQDVSGPEAGRA